MTQLTIGDIAPDFALPDTQGNTVKLSTLLSQAKAGVVVYFYPKAATPGCTKEACDFRDSLASLTSAGYTVVGISPDPAVRQERFAARHHLPFPLLSDVDHAVMTTWGVWGEKKNYGRVYTGVIRSTIVVAPDGKVTLAKYNVKATGHVVRLRKELGID